MIKDLTYGNPTKVILAFSVPIILGNLFQQIYSLVDMVIVGRFLGFQALAGVAELLIRFIASEVLPPHLGFLGVPLVDVAAWVGACTILAVSYYIQIPKE